MLSDCRLQRDEEWVTSEGVSSEIVISADSVSYLDSIQLMQFGSKATMRHVGLFGLIQVFLELIMSQFSHRSTLYTLRPFLGCESCLAI